MVDYYLYNQKHMKKIITIIIAILIVLVSAYLYATRSVEAPSAPIDELSAKMPDGTPGQSGVIYRIGQGSEARFSIYELLRGKDKTVMGATSDVGGDMRVVDGSLEVGTVTINARTWKTDSTQRDGAIGRFILKSETPGNELITFSPTARAVVADTIVEGKEFSFSVSGFLTISGTTKPATFSGQATLVGDVLTGRAEAKLSRASYGLVIPNLDFIANVPDEFTVGAEITATKIAI
jgi:polyisoprenoid-binding protein YceI